MQVTFHSHGIFIIITGGPLFFFDPLIADKGSIENQC